MQEFLRDLRIPSVLYSADNLFYSHEAMEVERVLRAFSDPNNENLLRAALATDMMGLRGEDLDILLKDETGWEKWLLAFREYHNLWKDRGFIFMFRRFLSREGVLPRLISFFDGERRATNILHLAEILHRISLEKNFTMPGFLKWLSEQKDENTPGSEEHQLRLESDEKAVRLATIHKSKGLEYPVVFCPFTWSDSRIKNSKKSFLFHDESDNMRLTLDLGSEAMDQNRVFAEKELLAENLRLLYVALTRAKSRCYLAWGRFNEAGTSAPAYLFHQPESGGKDSDIVSAVSERFKSLDDDSALAELKTLPDASSGAIRLSPMPMEAGEEYLSLSGEKAVLACKEFSGEIDRRHYISSFSSLISGRFPGAELADRDRVGRLDFPDRRQFPEADLKEMPSDIFCFPRGTKAGTFFHDIFEHLDFNREDAAQTKKLVADKLQEYGFELTWQESLTSMIRKVLSAPLNSENNDFTLSCIRDQERLNELEFYFPLNSISKEKLKSIFEKYVTPELSPDFPEHIDRLNFAPLKGFMKGFIDLVFRFQDRFYLVDWKSNFLGSRVEDYSREALSMTMEKEFYFLQYHIYAVALNQYLKARMPEYNYETHFGGVYYIFLRGVDPKKGNNFGIYRDRPSGSLINELSENLVVEKFPFQTG